MALQGNSNENDSNKRLKAEARKRTINTNPVGFTALQSDFNGHPDPGYLTALHREREQAKQDILEIREQMIREREKQVQEMTNMMEFQHELYSRFILQTNQQFSYPTPQETKALEQSLASTSEFIKLSTQPPISELELALQELRALPQLTDLTPQPNL